MRDIELVKRIKGGDHHAFKELYDKYVSSVFNICYRIVGEKSYAEDATQEIFLKIYKTINRFQSRSEFSTWIHRIAVNMSLNFLRKMKYEKWLLPLEIENTTDKLANKDYRTTNLTQPDRVTESRELQKIVQDGINKLPKNQRAAIILQKFEGLSYEEIAAIQGCSLYAVQSRISRAKKKLQKILNPFFNINTN